MHKDFWVGFKQGFKMTGENVSVLVNTLLLLFVYSFGIGLTCIIAKFKNKHFLETKLLKSKQSYWEDLNLNSDNETIEHYYKQF